MSEIITFDLEQYKKFLLQEEKLTAKKIKQREHKLQHHKELYIKNREYNLEYQRLYREKKKLEKIKTTVEN